MTLSNMKQNTFIVTSLDRDDLVSIGFNGESATNAEMQAMAESIHESICESGAFYDALEAAAESLGIKKIGKKVEDEPEQ